MGADAYIAGNVGTGTPREMQEWVEYMTAPHDSSAAARRRKNGRDAPWALPYFGVGNENWGCGGNMRPEYYADLYRHFATFVKQYDLPRRTQRVACGPNSADYNWTEVVMSRAAGMMDALSMHYYTLPTGDWHRKGSSTDFDEDGWFHTLKNTLRMDELVTKHSEIMDRHDPNCRVGLFVDEWGTWYDPSPGTNPGFLEQQNTLRDALVAALNLHIFHKHARRVQMANLAQTINVLQALILTRGPDMLQTPTYWVFEMLQGHQAGLSLPLEFDAPPYAFSGEEIIGLSGSASRNEANGTVLLSWANPHPTRAVELFCRIEGGPLTRATARVLSAPSMNARNTFEAPRALEPATHPATLAGNALSLTLPPKCVLTVELS
ncbi:MAG: alpha-L-arabinofuranosidase C-terminal domain-containing protein [Polyangiaceae bacterium]